MKIVGYTAFFVGGVVLCYLLVSMGVVDALDGIPGTQDEPAIALPTYLGFVSAMMTAVTTVLAAVAIGIGIVAAYTFKEIKDEAQKIASSAVDEAQKTASETVDKLISIKLSDDVIIAQITKIAFAQNTENIKGELDEDFDPDDAGER